MLTTTKKMVQLRNKIIDQHAQDIKGSGLAKYVNKRKNMRKQFSISEKKDFMQTQKLPSGRKNVTSRDIKFSNEAPCKSSESMVLGAKILKEVNVSSEFSSPLKDKEGTS